MAGKNVVELTDANFSEKTASGVALVDFWAPWCGPCRMQGPIIDELAEQVGDAALIAKLNVDDAPGVAAKFSVRSIPSLFLLKDGAVVEQYVGVQTLDKLLAAVKKHTSV
ncbi:MAG: thioredoxin [Kiritimatiellae bacterium]|nr:thioredoxin [Kiritimatiellia bacterium]MDD4736234.1 thioredoxin [Kiritimatiellia bacterium]